MQKLFILSIFSLLLLPGIALAQNTIGGVQTLVPEAEVKRQSQFLNAERERLLGRWDKALEAYKEIVFEYPDNDAAWYGLARTWSAKDDVVNAANAIAQAVKLSPENQWYILYQADLYEKTAGTGMRWKPMRQSSGNSRIIRNITKSSPTWLCSMKIRGAH